MGRAKMTLALGIIPAIITMRMIRGRHGIALADDQMPEMPVAQPPRRTYAARYKRQPKARKTIDPPAKRGDRSALPAAMQPPTISRTTEQP